ncbi:hypothetical protein SAMN03159488_02292 [Pseudomonas sp. NFIX10]|nr:MULTISPECIES: hypothetical protein [unclassified Pseudomonas]SFB19198.1 hypothetical protein SAMN03159488_02292 [Pseudomonas sp. NFIX10]SFE79467.1 hypothetical protein SAMN03159367_02103 [Pseudomonas sp. NFACC06-1]
MHDVLLFLGVIALCAAPFIGLVWWLSYRNDRDMKALEEKWDNDPLRYH